MPASRIQISDIKRVPENRDADCDWIIQHRDELLQRYGHVIIFVYREKVISTGATLQAALHDAELHLPPEPTIITPAIGFLSPVSPTINESIFWELMDSTRQASGGDGDNQADLLVEILSQRSAEDIIEYDLIFHQKRARAYLGNLWDAAYLIGCGCGDDGFTDFRAWLIGQGKEVYEKALIDPDSLADVVEPELRETNMAQVEMLNYVADYAYEDKTGRELPSMMVAPNAKYDLVGSPSGDDELIEAKFPHIVAKLGSCDDWWNTYLNREPHKD